MLVPIICLSLERSRGGSLVYNNKIPSYKMQLMWGAIQTFRDLDCHLFKYILFFFKLVLFYFFWAYWLLLPWSIPLSKRRNWSQQSCPLNLMFSLGNPRRMSGWVGDNNHVEPVAVNLMFSLGNPSQDVRVDRGQQSCGTSGCQLDVQFRESLAGCQDG